MLRKLVSNYSLVLVLQIQNLKVVSFAMAGVSFWLLRAEGTRLIRLVVLSESWP